MAFTQTKTQTFTRIILLNIQLGTLLRRTSQLSDQKIESITKYVEKQWIKKICVYALNDHEKLVAEIIFEIDWDKHNSFISVGKTTVFVESSYNDNIIIEVDEFIKGFNKFVNHYNLKTKCRLRFVKEVLKTENYFDEVREDIGIKKIDNLSWSGPTASDNAVCQELPEINLSIQFELS